MRNGKTSRIQNFSQKKIFSWHIPATTFFLDKIFLRQNIIAINSSHNKLLSWLIFFMKKYSDKISPLQNTWIIAKKYLRQNFPKTKFPGDKISLRHLQNKVSTKKYLRYKKFARQIRSVTIYHCDLPFSWNNIPIYIVVISLQNIFATKYRRKIFFPWQPSSQRNNLQGNIP